jgi:copper chaperone
MKTEKIYIANLKCGGCESTIKNKLNSIEGVQKVSINQEEDSVAVEYNDEVKRETITSMLHHLGYPEATEENGLLLKLKSYASCMVGRLNPQTETAENNI